jgi:hypothetical protein
VCRYWDGFVDDFFVLIIDGRSRATRIVGPIVIESNAEKSGVRTNADNEPPTRAISETRATTIDGTEKIAARKKRETETRGD